MKQWAVTATSLAALVLIVAATLCAEDPTSPTLPSARTASEANRRQLRRSSIQAPRERSDGDPGGLKAAIDRLHRSMNPTKPSPPVERKAPTTRPAATTQPKPATRPATTQPAMTNSEMTERIRKLNNIADPAALGDALFQAGHPNLAAVFYDRAVKGQTAPMEKAWMLFQAGNCRRRTDPQAALKAYDTLVAAHPESPWSSIALVQKGIVEWRNTKNLAALFKDIERQGQQSSGSPERK